MTAEAFAVSRTLQALEVVAFGPATAPQVAGTLRINARTARRMLNRLVADGWLTRAEGRGQPYEPTMRIVALAAHVAQRSPLARHAAPSVRALAAETRLDAHLVIPSYRAVLCLVHAAGERPAPPALRELIPAATTASGRVLLAFRPAWRESVLDEADAGIERVVERGWADEDGSYVPGIRAVAAPVRAPGGDVVAAIGVSGPAGGLLGDDREPLAARVVDRASQAAAALAATGRERGWLSD